ncbi:hypothetical protein IFR09_05980 [Pseudomonas syringae]|nr:hypothetical protein [Pseudomonas syringae]MBD8574716.1 hypothetical protein [Pseudomonas syringae]MBD8789279.1 hypothetical protein [Pseudomonas syringae]MBD8800277.1 hypothetical protein [Pseudomonas syringae]MBD8810707.1 hypothetical protein [Pseudomonas syringae]
MKDGNAVSVPGVMVLLAILSTPLPTRVQAGEVEDTALAFVQERQLGDGLGWLGYQVASRTETFGQLVERLGKTQAQALVQGELKRVQPQYQGQWERNLARAYAHSFNADELRQLNQGQGSLALKNRFKVRNNEVGQEMKNSSAQLLSEFVAQALNNALKTPVP